MRAKGKRFADVMEALVGAAYVSDASAAELAGRLLDAPPSWEAGGGGGGGSTGGGEGAPMDVDEAAIEEEAAMFKEDEQVGTT